MKKVKPNISQARLKYLLKKWTTLLDHNYIGDPLYQSIIITRRYMPAATKNTSHRFYK